MWRTKIDIFKTNIEFFVVLLQLLKALRNTTVDINGTTLKFDSNGNPNIGYGLVELIWKNSSLEFLKVGSFNKILKIKKSLFKWHTENSEVSGTGWNFHAPISSRLVDKVIIRPKIWSYRLAAVSEISKSSGRGQTSIKHLTSLYIGIYTCSIVTYSR